MSELCDKLREARELAVDALDFATASQIREIEDKLKTEYAAPPGPVWLDRLADGNPALVNGSTEEVAKYVQRLRNAAWAVVRMMLDSNNVNKADRRYMWKEIAPLKNAVLEIES